MKKIAFKGLVQGIDVKSTFAIIFYFLFLEVFACPKSLRAYPKECELSDSYQSLKKNTYDRYGINLEYLTGYRARRLIDRDVWEKEQGRIRCRPEKAYLPDPDVWINWEKGANYISSLLLDERLKNEDMQITKPRIQSINIQSVNGDIMGFMATKIKGAKPGRIRQNYHELPGFTFNCVGGKVTDEHVLNVGDFDIKDDNGDPLVSVVAHSCPGSSAMQGVLSYTATTNVENELKKLLEFTKMNIAKYENGTNDPNYSPLQFIADVQRWFVAIHPFGDGNGRTSRFLQDYLLAKFGLPYAPSGNLQNDVLMTKEGYQELFAKEMIAGVEELKGCTEEFKEMGFERVDDLSCNCRPLYPNEKHVPVVQFSTPDDTDCSGERISLSPELNSEFESFFFNLSFALESDTFL